jgi:hypothetical protein
MSDIIHEINLKSEVNRMSQNLFKWKHPEVDFLNMIIGIVD